MSVRTQKRHGMARHFNNEVIFLQKLKHPYIVKVIESADLTSIYMPMIFRESLIEKP
jgi:hypothetical protein